MIKPKLIKLFKAINGRSINPANYRKRNWFKKKKISTKKLKKKIDAIRAIEIV